MLQNTNWEIVAAVIIAFMLGWLVMGWLTWGWRRTDFHERRAARVDGLESEVRHVGDRIMKLETDLGSATHRALAAERELSTARSAIVGLECDLDDLAARLQDRDAELCGLLEWARSLEDERAQYASELRSSRFAGTTEFVEG